MQESNEYVYAIKNACIVQKPHPFKTLHSFEDISQYNHPGIRAIIALQSSMTTKLTRFANPKQQICNNASCQVPQDDSNMHLDCNTISHLDAILVLKG